MASHPGFSGVIRIANISDFIEPAQKCILPQPDARGESLAQKAKETSGNLVGIHTGKNRPERSEIEEGKKVKVTLNDCLACSGCITTAETMLVESQTIDQMIEGIRTHAYSVVTVSPQSMSSLAVKLAITPRQLALYFKSIGARYVLDSSFARLLTRRLYYEEFCARHHLLPQVSGQPPAHIPNSHAVGNQPIFTGVCPGFVCYAEKTHGDLLVQLISHVRSPQAISGRLVKDYLARKLRIDPTDIFHIALMPCYDKKLEASRADFLLPQGCREVDCVVTASELETPLIEYLEHHTPQEMHNGNANGEGVQEAIGGWLSRMLSEDRMMGESDKEGSGGYTEYIAHRLSTQTLPGASVQREHRAKDLEVISISSPLLATQVRLAKLYGFRNIQNAVQKLKRNKLELDFVEIMACPSGCVNGGGQIRGSDLSQTQQICAEVLERYSEFNQVEEAERELNELESDWQTMSPHYRESLFTDYHKVAKNILGVVSW